MLKGLCMFRKLTPFFVAVTIQFQAMSSHQQPTLTRCKTFLRHDQECSSYNECAQDNVKIYAPKWVEEGLEIIAPRINGAILDVWCTKGDKFLGNKTLTGKISLRDLQILSRNEAWNTSGIIKFSNYEPQNKSLIISLKDLVRQCTIVGSDETTHFGGYPQQCSKIPQKAKVYICDLAGLQFQNENNSGRLVLIGRENIFPVGELDDFIFEKVVGEKKKTFEEVKNIHSNRYVSTDFTRRSGEIFFDTIAYKRFVANDVVLCGIALDKMVSESSEMKRVVNNETCGPSDCIWHFPTVSSLPKETVVLKFLKYGSGFFAGPFGRIIEKHILTAVIDGLEKLFDTQEIKHIKAVEFPFYNYDPKQDARLKALKAKYGVDYRFSNDDALKTTWQDHITATTNCADPHAAMGNEMGYSSVDAAIATNLKSSGNIFSPLLNPKMAMEYIDFHTVDSCHEHEGPSASSFSSL